MLVSKKNKTIENKLSISTILCASYSSWKRRKIESTYEPIFLRQSVQCNLCEQPKNSEKQVNIRVTGIDTGWKRDTKGKRGPTKLHAEEKPPHHQTRQEAQKLKYRSFGLLNAQRRTAGAIVVLIILCAETEWRSEKNTFPSAKLNHRPPSVCRCVPVCEWAVLGIVKWESKSAVPRIYSYRASVYLEIVVFLPYILPRHQC